MTERRATPRVRLPLDVAIDGTAAHLHDLSAGGVAVLTPKPGAPGGEVELTQPLPDRAPPLVARAQVVRRDEAHTAFRLLALTPDERQRVERFVLSIARLGGAQPG